MIKNANVEHFKATAFDVSKTRTRFYIPSQHKTDFTTGKLIPIYMQDILPGDSVKLSMSSVVRGSTPIFPVFDNAFVEYFAFFTPNRLVYEHWEEFMGDNKNDFWTQKTDFFVPQISLTSSDPEGALHTPVDYMGAVGSLKAYTSEGSLKYVPFNALFPRVYVKTWNDWYRDQNNQEPAHLYLDDVDRTATINNTSKTDYVTYAEYGTALLPVNKYHDQFTSALPQPQKHAPITIPIGTSAPVVDGNGENLTNLYMYESDGTRLNNSVNRVLTIQSGTGKLQGGYTKLANKNIYQDASETLPIGFVGNEGNDQTISNYAMGQQFSLRADLTNATAITVDQLNLAIKTQYFYQTLGRGGSRYIETLRSMFGVYAADSRLQRSEYLGGKRVPITQVQVAQTSKTDTTSVLGDTGAFSLTNDNSLLVNKSFSEHGILQIYACVRTSQTYSQGQERQFARRSLFDYYFPVFANIGEVGILNKEIYTEDGDKLDEVFGYQEAWYDYRYKPNRVSGYMRPEVTGSLSAWNYANKFDTLPVLNSDFIKETEVNVERTLAVQDTSQWFADFSFTEIITRVMPPYSIPSLSTRF